MKKWMFGIIVSVILFGIIACETNQEKVISVFIQNYIDRVQPLLREQALAYWQAATTGSEKSYKKSSELELEIRNLHNNSADFARIKAFKDSADVQDHRLNRQIGVLYNSYLPNQVDSSLLQKIVELSTGIEQTFSTFRGIIDGENVSNNQIETILKNETDSDQRKKAWLASKQVGMVIASDIIKLAQLRNENAQSLGFDTYHTMALAASEQNVADVDRIFSELEILTTEPFRRLKNDLDAKLAKMYNISVNELYPWHYHDPFFQETPLIYDIDLDAYYADKDVVELAREFYSSIHLPVNDILENSDLYERDGKNPHAFCTDIDRNGDIRILCNVKNNERWMETMLHELGHAVYDKYIYRDLPFLLRTPAHSFTTEAVAMYFGRLSRNADWMKEALDLSPEEHQHIARVAGTYMQLKQLIFARWAMVMYHFEKQLYADPEADLNTLWWDLVERFQLLQRPPRRDTPDWAAKIHIALYPAYYHNYLLGELLASQLQHTISQELESSRNESSNRYFDRTALGDILKTRVFQPGNLNYWDEMITKATGEPLTAKYFVDQFIE